MGDLELLLCLILAVICAILAYISSRVLLQEKRGADACLFLAVSVCVGIACALPFSNTNLSWFPYIGGIYFGTVTLNTLFRLAHQAALSSKD